jgi:hypothetical protein
MSLFGTGRKPEVEFFQQSRAKVKPDSQSIRDAVTARIGLLPRGDERIRVKLGDGQEFVIDLAEAIVGDQALHQLDQYTRATSLIVAGQALA